MKNAIEIFSERHRGEGNRSSETDRGRNKSGHEADGRMINLGKKMIFAAGTRKCCAQLTVTKRAAERGDSPNDPEHEQSKTRVDVGNLKSEAGEHAGANNVCNHDPARCEKTDGSSRSLPIRRGRLGQLVHDRVDPPKDGFVAANNGMARVIRQSVDDRYCQKCRLAAF